MDEVKFLVVGLGSRGSSMIKTLADVKGAVITAVCDVYEDRVESARDVLEEKTGIRPAGYIDFDEALNHGVDAVMISSAWETHIPFSVKAMEKGVITLCEVGGAYSVDDCFRLVEAYERTKTPIMLLENCCYANRELLATAMARNGLFGEIVHCDGEYAHDLRKEVTEGKECRHYRLRNYLTRNCDNYPTHELGPIAKLLGINRGNRMVSLVSVASKSAGMEAWVEAHKDTINPALIGKDFNQGDVVTTIIKCSGGQTITIRLDTCLPRHYSRNFTVRGTKGLYEQNCNMVYLDGMQEDFNTSEHYMKNINNAEQYEEKYLCDIWKNITPEAIAAGHGGMDTLMLEDAVARILDGREFPIDVYDMAAWMAITPLTEQSIALGGAPVEIPDFTHGEWIRRKIQDVTELPLYDDEKVDYTQPWE